MFKLTHVGHFDCFRTTHLVIAFSLALGEGHFFVSLFVSLLVWIGPAECAKGLNCKNTEIVSSHAFSGPARPLARPFHTSMGPGDGQLSRKQGVWSAQPSKVQEVWGAPPQNAGGGSGGALLAQILCVFISRGL